MGGLGTIPPPLGGSMPAPADGFIGTPQSDATGRVTLFTIMGEAKRASNDKPFRGGEMTAFMGGCVLDLRQAIIAPGNRRASTCWRSWPAMRFWVPHRWSVVTDVVPLLGGMDDKRLPPIEVAARTVRRGCDSAGSC